MQQSVKWVLGLIIFFIITINALQVVWIYNNYKEQDQQYKRLLTNCLVDAVSYYQLHQIRKVRDRSATFYIISSSQQVQPQFTDTSQRRLLLAASGKILLDSISGSLGHSQLIQMQNRNSFNLQLFDSLFKVELNKHHIDAPYVLRTEGSNVSQKQKQPLPKKDSLVPTKMNYATDLGSYTVKTAGMLINIYGNHFVYAAFKTYPQFVFRKMVWMLVLSLFLSIAVNFALNYVFKTIRRQKKINEIKNDFINNMTHELRTPITIASGALDVLLNHHGLNDQQKTKKYLQASREELLHLDHLVEKILNLAVEDKDDIQLNYEKVNLKHIFSTVIENHTLIHSKEVKFYLDQESLDNDLYLDRMHFSNAMNNIIDNAIKYTEAPVKIHIIGSINQNKLQLLIIDNGPGIDKEHQAAIFEPFYRIPTGDLHNVKGFGLGLSYVKKIIQKHGGSIEIKSQLGKGSTFIINIPIMNTNV